MAEQASNLVPVQPARPGRQPGAPAGRLRVLLVEDDEADAFLVRELLAEVNAPVDLTVVGSLASAHTNISTMDCVLLDLNLPDATGLAALRHVLELTGHAAVCVLTGLEDEHIGMAAVAEGAQDYLVKGQVDGVLLFRALRYAVERKRAEENARRLRDIEHRQAESARLERGLLPQPLMQTEAVALHSFYRPGRHRGFLGGDFFDVVQTAPDQLNLLVGDVCGHGVDEAALGVELRVAWRALVLAGVPDEDVLPAVEQVLVSERPSEEIFATVATVTVDLARRRLLLRLAGHPPPLLVTRDTVTPLNGNRGPVLGIFPDARRTVTEFPLDRREWALLTYTDGIIEGRTGRGSERLEVGGLCALIDRARGEGVPLIDLPEWLVTRAEQANGGPLADDVAMLLIAPASIEINAPRAGGAP